ncbi:MAG: hypothetical protein A3C43_01960 [Candidatus Schekmanbacteria bacterium RIFCSPHIGHO2_02_FULL_38_11]|uniref:Uncharacterized protein n=1 Tax=Candidatus Schekmanbacteria bacterium RIFCSPLOWO2_12_FULL_38_15 TaxID=1817883 RepID=A0A1F7SFK9_9BACT|nr:MAG: hypothetical protein A2043_06890 [Candidatus Schekmanbacteria bacterium GWA2_38_9]OGL48569.1 MAG: hypothetical protein A3H37_05705 [Candidatus Schekmanbacteria bacterium RIFCSPLOWO2_02_FULL_38_14]OGL52549.1 MAG: hypothetical protein A3G31_11265 [Candidatus Schekmanbacteria bacterium RIFCSPLOWO2_12_FULL_38_15]OGL53258.1 MAG: hypothetical protein A3C43_01960 [Candidatus Schekmanbacteria bacterium RIFCSPHIGHO2_02_FULL_38_11]
MKKSGALGFKLIFMKCPYYSDEPIKICKAFLEGIKMPSKKEIKEYCLSENYEKCVFFQKKEKDIWESENDKEPTPIKL